MVCFVPFNNRNLDMSFFIFRSTVVLVDNLLDALKHFSLCTETLGCVYSSIFQSIHGNMIIWYGAWMKRTNENKELLSAALLSMLTNVSSMAILVDYRYFDAYAGESRDGSPAAKFSTGDIISMNAALLSDQETNNLPYACLALFKSYFVKMEGVLSGVCMKSQDAPRVACLYVWKSLQSCYSWILNSDCRQKMQSYVNDLSLDVKYDIFRVVYVNGDTVLKFPPFPNHGMIDNGGASTKSKEMEELQQKAPHINV